MANLRIKDRNADALGDEELEAGFYLYPKALLFRDLYLHPLRAWSCGECGYTELHVENPQELWRVYQETQKSRQGDK
jgi:hypothetical protein